MAITNLDKPTATQGKSYLNIGSGFNLLVGGLFKLIINPASSSGLITNTNKASIGETWGAISSTWTSETRTWLAASQLIVNNTKQSSVISNENKPA